MSKDFESIATPLVINDKDWGNPISDDVQINQHNLDKEFLDQAEKYAWWAFLAEHAKAKCSELKTELDVFYAHLDARVRAKAQLASADAKEGKGAAVRYTEKMVENEVISDPDYRKMLDEYNEMKLKAGLCAAGTNAMIQRKDMLMQLGANYRAEGQADPIILKEAAKEKAAQYAKEQAEKKAERKAKLEQAQAAINGATETVVETKFPPFNIPKRPPGKPIK